MSGQLAREIDRLERSLLDDLEVEKDRLALQYARECGIISFTEFTFSQFESSWHHELIGDYIDEFVFGDLDRLIITVPPRHGKSELVSRRLPAYIFGHFPDYQIISASYSADLAEAMNRDVQMIMESEAYRRVFPDTRLPTEKDPETKTQTEFQVAGRRGYYRGCGIGGGITGRGANVGLIDDPFKNRVEADSPAYRERVWKWYQSTFYTRLESPAKVCIIHTRWHEDDLIGRLLEEARRNPRADQWEVVRLPAVAEGELHPEDPRKPGEGLWPSKFDALRYERIRITVGSREWGSLYQQNPTTPEGNMVKREFWQFYKELPASFDEQIQSWDLRFTSKADDGDYVIGQVWGRVGARKYLIAQVRDRLSFTGSISAIRTLSARWPNAYLKLVEKKANGEALEDTLKEEIPGIVLQEPRGDKVSRVNSVLPTIEAHNVFLPDPSIAPWIEDFIKEAAEFPKGANDDQVDAMSQALQRFKESESSSRDNEALGML